MPVLILTGYPNLFHAEAFAGGPPATLFTKPVDYVALKSALREALQASTVNDPSIDPGPAIASEDLTVPPELESIAENARRNALSGAQAVRALRRP